MDSPAVVRFDLEFMAIACRQALSSLSRSTQSMFFGFPAGTCGPASEILGRLLKEFSETEGRYVCASRHPSYEPEQTHAWVEVGDYIIDITYDQFPDTGLTGWVFEGGTDWHSSFCSVDRRGSFMSPEKWDRYPHDGYNAALDEIPRYAKLLMTGGRSDLAT